MGAREGEGCPMTDPITTGPGPFIKNRRPHFVYQCWSDTRCLYVGISVKPISRLAVHSGADWWAQVRHIESDWYPDKAQAMAKERSLIEQHQPVHNWQHSENAEGSRTGHGAGGVAWRKADLLP